MQHKSIPLADRHAPHAYEFADAAARVAATGFVAADEHKLALQLDTHTYWILTQAVPPAWISVTAAGNVSSVNGKTGDVVLVPGDVGAESAGAAAAAVAAHEGGSDVHAIGGVAGLQSALDGKVGRTGFPVDASGNYLCTLTYNETTRTVTVTPTAASFDVLVGGVTYNKLGAQSIVHGSTQGGHFIYYDETGTLVTGTTVWDLLRHAPVCFVFWDASNSKGVPFEERHHAGRDVYWHRNQHANEGTKISSGFAASGFTLSDGSADAAVTFAIASGRVEDEDIRVDTQALADNGPYTLLWRSGAAGDWQIDRTPVRPFFDAANVLQYNQNTGATWQKTALAEDEYVNYYVLATTALPTTAITPTPNAMQQLVIVPGQAGHATQALANAEVISALNWGALPFQELAPLYQVTMRYNASNPGAYINTARCAIVAITRIVGSFASIAQVAPVDHGSLLGNADDDHLQYAMTNPLVAAVTYNASGTTTVTLDGGRTEIFTAIAATGPTTWAFAGAVASGKISSFTLELTNGGSQTQTWPAAVKWDGGTAPTLTAAGLDILEFYTRDGGTTWRGFLAAKDSK